MEGNGSIQSMPQKAVGQNSVDSHVVMCKAGGALGYCQASDQVIGREVFAGEYWIGPGGFKIWREL